MGGNVTDWAPYQNFVQSGLPEGATASSKYTLFAAGPPRLADVGGTVGAAQAIAQGGEAANRLFFPLGVIQQANLTQTKQFQRIFELGSWRSYFVPGHNTGQITLGRAYLHGASILRIMYAYYQDSLPGGGVTVRPMYQNNAVQNVANPHDVMIAPGYENLYVNLASDLFDQPIGLVMYVRDSNLRTLGATYFEHCVIPNHSLSVAAEGIVLQEQIAMQYEWMQPVAITDVPLVTGDTPYTGGSASAGQFVSSGN